MHSVSYYTACEQAFFSHQLSAQFPRNWAGNMFPWAGLEEGRCDNAACPSAVNPQQLCLQWDPLPNLPSFGEAPFPGENIVL